MYYICSNEHGISKEGAYKEIEKILINAWKDINEELLKPNRVPRIVLKYFINFGSMSEFLYEFVDAFTDPYGLNDFVSKLLLKQLPM